MAKKKTESASVYEKRLRATAKLLGDGLNGSAVATAIAKKHKISVATAQGYVREARKVLRLASLQRQPQSFAGVAHSFWRVAESAVAAGDHRGAVAALKEFRDTRRHVGTREYSVDEVALSLCKLVRERTDEISEAVLVELSDVARLAMNRRCKPTHQAAAVAKLVGELAEL